MPVICGNCAVSAVATPSMISDNRPSTCSRITMMTTMTPTARNPGTSRTACSSPISAPSNRAASTTKLFSNANQTEKAIGMAKAMRKRSVTGRRQNGNDRA